MSYFAAAFTRTGGGWQGNEIDLDDVDDIEDVAEVAGRVESDDGLVVVVLEEDDWFGVVRVESDDEPRVYVSDAVETLRTGLGEALLSELAAEFAVSGDDVTDLAAEAPRAEPLGEAGLLDDLGVPAAYLTKLARGSDTSPADAVAALAERLGCVDALEAVR